MGGVLSMTNLSNSRGMLILVASILFTGVAYAAQEANGCPPTITQGDITWTRVGTGWEVETCIIVGYPPFEATKCTTEGYFRYLNDLGQYQNRNCAGAHWVA
jgi:hypothetical protein